MKKIILIVVFIALVATPWFAGLAAKARIENYAQEFDALPGYTATIESYNAGYLDSEAVLNVAFDTSSFAADLSPEEQAEFQAFVDGMMADMAFHLDIRHGPFLNHDGFSTGLFHAELSLEENPAALESLKDKYGIEQLLTTEFTLGFGGSGEFVMTAPPFEFDEAEGRVTFGGFDYRANLQDWGALYEGKGELHETIGTVAGTTFKLAPVTMDMQGDFSQGFLAGTGEFKMEMQGLDVVGESSFSFEGLAVTATVTSPTPETLDITYRYALRELSSSDMEYPLNNLVMNASMLHLNKQAVREAYELWENFDQTLEGPLFTQQVIEIIGKVYGNGAEFRLDEISFTYGPEVQMLLNASYVFKPEFFTGLGNGTGPDPLAMMGAMDASMNLDVSQGLVDLVLEMVLRSQMAAVQAPPEQIEQLIELQKAQMSLSIPPLIQSGMLTASTRGYQTELAIKDGTVTINGNPVPLPGLQ